MPLLTPADVKKMRRPSTFRKWEARLALIANHLYKGPSKPCFASNKSLAKLWHCSERSVSRTLRVLNNVGAIKIVLKRQFKYKNPVTGEVFFKSLRNIYVKVAPVYKNITKTVFYGKNSKSDLNNLVKLENFKPVHIFSLIDWFYSDRTTPEPIINDFYPNRYQTPGNYRSKRKRIGSTQARPTTGGQTLDQMIRNLLDAPIPAN